MTAPPPSGGARGGGSWRLVATSVIGPSHERGGQPNQDRAGALAPSARSHETRLVAVSDGHGEQTYFRSDRGAAFAVEASLVTSLEFLKSGRATGLHAVQDWAGERQPGEVLRRWRDLVADDLTTRPFTIEELGAVRNAGDGDGRARAVALAPLKAYGATLLGATIVRGCIVYSQIGDGDIVTVSADGRVTQPLHDDAHAFANVTSSLCDADPLSSWRTSVQDQRSHGTEFVLLASDGYSGAFEDKASFLGTVGALAGVLRSGGEDKLRATLDQSVAKARTFSGDDTTVAVLYRSHGGTP